MIKNNKFRLSKSLRAQTTPYPNLSKTVKRISLFLLIVGLVAGYLLSQSSAGNEIATDEQNKQILGEQTDDSPYELYQVKNGDTLFNVSQRYGIRWERVAELNKLSEPYTLKPGSEIKIPK